MSDCQRYLEMMQQQLDGELSEFEAKMLEKHVHQCPFCREEYNAFQRIGHLLNGIELEEAPLDLKDLIMADIMQIDLHTECQTECQTDCLTDNQIDLHATLELDYQISQESGMQNPVTRVSTTAHMRNDRVQNVESELLANPVNSEVGDRVSKKPKFVVSLLVALAAVNLVFFYYWLQPNIGVRVNTQGFAVLYHLVSDTFSNFVIVGRHAGDALQIIVRAIAGVIPWEWVFYYTLITSISVVGMLSMLRKRGGNII